ncbi:MAG: sulfotransferase [Actinomycetota bacterium]|nr:sulfotransferase [Actinomycetota bacterium]
MSLVLVVGVPRSGTTWVGTLLGSTQDSAYVEEPDNHLTHPFAFRAKYRLPGRFYTALHPDDEAPEYERLWREALRPAARRNPSPDKARRALCTAVWRLVAHEEIRRAFLDPNAAALKLRAAKTLAVPVTPLLPSRHVVVKSVYAALSLEWIAARFPVRVVIVRRHLLNVISSWMELRWVGTAGNDMLDSLDPDVQDRLSAAHGVPLPEPGASSFARGTWLLGVLDLALQDAARRHPDWLVVSHEVLCDDPALGFRSLSHQLGLGWTPAAERVLDSLNRPGRGTERARLSSQLPEVWRSRLRRDQLAEIAPLLDRFGLDA